MCTCPVGDAYALVIASDGLWDALEDEDAGQVLGSVSQWLLSVKGGPCTGETNSGTVEYDGPTVAPWNHSPKGSPQKNMSFWGKCSKTNLSFEGVLRA